MSRHGLGLVVLCAGVVLASGCGAPLTFIPVEGTVTKGGRPLRGIEVVFLSDPDAGTLGPRATGKTDEAGHYRLRTDGGEEGAVAGKHLVLLLDLEARNKRLARPARGQPPKQATQGRTPKNTQRLLGQLKLSADAPRVPPRYGRINETPLRADVHLGPQTFDFNIP